MRASSEKKAWPSIGRWRRNRWPWYQCGSPKLNCVIHQTDLIEKYRAWRGKRNAIVKIKQIETTVLEMRYKKPLVTATHKFVVARGLLVRITTDNGVEGDGYTVLFPRTGETPETARHAIEDILNHFNALREVKGHSPIKIVRRTGRRRRPGDSEAGRFINE
jgi:Mandelate racemase / muconate lactonizing enzyme, N-terminal domain